MTGIEASACGLRRTFLRPTMVDTEARGSGDGEEEAVGELRTGMRWLEIRGLLDLCSVEDLRAIL